VTADFTHLNTLLVSDRPGSQKYFAAALLETPVVTPKWLDDCKSTGEKQPKEPYRLNVFTSFTICITGFTKYERAALEQLITSNGGVFSTDLHKNCTHLIAKV